MSAGLVWGLLGLAALDSLNPATLVAVSLILLGSRSRPVAEALAFVSGAFATVVLVGLALFLGADAVASSLPSVLDWIRRGAFVLAGSVLLLTAVRALRPRRRRAVGLPAWFDVRTAAALGVVMTAADLPNAFPYVIAIERMLAAEVPAPTGAVAVVLYAAVYCVPCLVLLAVGLRRGEGVRAALEVLQSRFGTEAVVPASRTRALGYLVAAVAVASLALLV